jgi:hypothetical protein
MDQDKTHEDDVPDLPDELDGLPDGKRKDGPPAVDDPANPDAHGPIIQA